MRSAFELMAFVSRSENRLDTLRALESAPASRSALQEATGIPRATLSRILSEFQDRELADRDGYEFSITPLGRLLAGELRSVFATLDVGEDLQTLAPWLPFTALGIDVSALADARVTLPTPVDPLAPITRTAAVLASSHQVRGLCNNVIPDLLGTLGDAEAELEVVVTADAFEIVSATPATSEVVRGLLESGRLDLAVSPAWFPQLAIEADGTVLLEVTDGEGAIRGLVESEAEALGSWFAAEFEALRGQSRRVAPELLAQ